MDKITQRIATDSVKFAMNTQITVHKQQIAVNAYQRGALDTAARAAKLVSVLDNISKGQNGELKAEYIDRVVKASKAAIKSYYNDWP